MRTHKSIKTSACYKDLLLTNTKASQMPITFANGTVWEELTGLCIQCGDEIPNDAVRGSITVQSPQMVFVEAIGACHDCKLLSGFFYRLYDNKSLSGPKEGKWCTWSATPISLLSRIRMLITK
jgi:hypothetical protein